jgi:predicted nucleotidyltransferase
MLPNNILALEYLRVLDQESIPLQPLTIPRQGAGYHSTELSSYASASAIRRSILENGALDRAGQFMPASSIHILQSELSAGRSPIVQRSLEQSILLHLRTTPAETLGNINEVTEGLEYKIHRAAMTCTNLDDLCQAVKSKRYSMTRIKRILLYALLGISHQKVQLFDQYGPLYLHILAFSTQGQKILQQMKNNSHARILSRGSDFKKAHASSNEPVLSAMLDLDRKLLIYTPSFIEPGLPGGPGFYHFTR